MVPTSDTRSSAAARGDLPRITVGGVLAAIVSGPGRWFRAATWGASAQLGAWFVMSWAFAAITLLGLLASLATVRIERLRTATRTPALRRAVLRMFGRTVSADMARIEEFSRARVDPLVLRRAADADDARAPWRSPLTAYELSSAFVAGALTAGAVAWWWATIAGFAHIFGPEPYYSLSYLRVFGTTLLGPSKFLTTDNLLVIVGIAAGVLLWPTVVRIVPVLDAALARSLLASGNRELSEEVERLSETRTQAVAAADAERRRIERDLHDGFQPQLVNLALNLGLARSRLADDPEGARDLIDRAHDDAKRATADLRNLVRGIHPSVLDERGLDAAFSALAASSAVPLQIDIHLDRRPPRGVEGIAYFVVAEAITNINKHARAGRATVTITEIDGELRVLVQDDGRGGAVPEAGGGLAGLAARVAGVDGTFSVASPNGGPTWIEARIPCAR